MKTSTGTTISRIERTRQLHQSNSLRAMDQRPHMTVHERLFRNVKKTNSARSTSKSKASPTAQYDIACVALDKVRQQLGASSSEKNPTLTSNRNTLDNNIRRAATRTTTTPRSPDNKVHHRLHRDGEAKIAKRQQLQRFGAKLYSPECTFAPKLLKPSRSFYRAQKEHKVYKINKSAAFLQQWWRCLQTRKLFQLKIKHICSIQNAWRRSQVWQTYLGKHFYISFSVFLVCP